MRPKRFLPKILIIIGFLALFLLFRYQSSIKDFCSFNLERLKIYCDNFFFQLSSRVQRRRPFSLLKRETELKLYVGEPFIDFTQDDWNYFWNLIYGAFPKGLPEREGLPNRMRQLTQDEIAFELMNRYPRPFTYYKESHWKTFFGLVFKR